MPYVVHYTDPAVADEDVDAEEMAREGAWLAFRRTEIVIGRPGRSSRYGSHGDAVSGVEQQGVYEA